MPGALEGITVIDFGQYVAGPLTAMLLADQGADVVRVDPPAGPRWRTPANQVWNRGKRSIVLDLTLDGDRSIARRLVRSADVLVENFRPGVMARFGLGPEAMLDANPALVYCSVPGFAHDDDRAAVPAWEGLVQAAAAVPADPADAPVMSAIPVASVYGAFLAAMSTTMALLARARDGRGQWIEIPLFEATLIAHGFRIQRVHEQPIVPDPGDPRDGIHGWMGAYRCRDGRYVFFHPGNRRAAEFVAVVGGAGWEGDPERPQRIRALFLTRTAAEWEELGNEVGTEIVIFRTSAEWLSETNARLSGLVEEIDDHVYGPMAQPGVQVQLSRTPGAIRGPAPLPDADRDDVLTELRRPRAVVWPASTHGALAALDGVNVIELSLLLAGPTCGRTLADFGAKVTKIESPVERETPAAWAASYRAFHVDVNRGKRSIIVDLRTDGGLGIFWRLLDGADVVVQNFRPGAMDALGIGYEAVRERNPRIVYASIDTYGLRGPWRPRRGHEHLGQASTGMAERFGGDGIPKFQSVRAICDHGTGLMAAFAVGLALVERNRSGEGQHVNASLAATGAILQAPFAYDFPGRSWEEPRGQHTLGSGPLQRLYRARDGWLFVGVPVERARQLAVVAGLEDVDPSAEDLESQLEARFHADDVAAWCSRLTHAGLGAHPMMELSELVDDGSLLARGLMVTREHRGIGVVDQLAALPHLSRTPARIGPPATPRGSDALEILAECGLSNELDRMNSAGTVVLV